MKLLKHITSTVSVFALTSLIAVQQAHASIPNVSAAPATEPIPFEVFISFIVNTGLNIIFLIAAIAATFYIIWAGVQYITSNGDVKKTESARGAIINGVIGLIIVVSAFFIVQVALGAANWLTGGANDPKGGDIEIQ